MNKYGCSNRELTAQRPENLTCNIPSLFVTAFNAVDLKFPRSLVNAAPAFSEFIHTSKGPKGFSKLEGKSKYQITIARIFEVVKPVKYFIA